MHHKIILASKSPRRQELIKALNLEFIIKIHEIDESFPAHLKKEKVPLYLAEQKAAAFKEDPGDYIILTADTIVSVDEQVINKPADKEEAVKMLQLLSGRMHEVYTGVCLKSSKKQKSFFEKTEVYFNKLTSEEIELYIEKYKPYDKAGAYGIQEWIGYIGIEKINGDFYNVMGLPVSRLYRELKLF